MRVGLVASYVFFGVGLAMSVLPLPVDWSRIVILMGVVLLLATPLMRLALLAWRWKSEAGSRLLAVPAFVALVLYAINAVFKLMSS